MPNEIKVPFVNLGAQFERFQDEIVEAFISLSRKGAYVGPMVGDFECEFAGLCGTKFALGVANGTDALFLCMKAWGVGPGDEVIVPTNSFLASAGAVAQTGANVVFVDVDETYNMDPTKVEQVVSDNTKVIMPVHLTGMPADMDAINAIAKKYNLKVLEDSAQAVDATYKGKKVGNLGDAAGFSLHPLKNLHVQGDGGMMTTNDEELFEKLKLLRNHGLQNRNESSFWGYNSRLDSIQAAIGLIKIKEMKSLTSRFQEIAQMYFDGLKDIVKVPVVPAGCEGVFHNFVIQVDNRTQLQEYLLNEGVETKIHYPIPIHLQQAANIYNFKQGDFPVAETQAEKILSLPIYPEIYDSQVELVVKSIRNFYN